MNSAVIYFWKEDYEDATAVVENAPFKMEEYHHDAFKIHLGNGENLVDLVEISNAFITEYVDYLRYINDVLEDTTLNLHFECDKEALDNDMCLPASMVKLLCDLNIHFVIQKK